MNIDGGLKMRFANKVAIVTASAGAGIGQATARALAAEGASLVISDQHPRRPSEVARAIHEQYRVPALPVVCDVTQQSQINDMTRKAMEAYGRIDILVNNAGFDVFKTLDEMDVASIAKVVDINLMATILVSKSVMPHMMRQRSGSIVNLSSIAAHSPDSGDSSIYAASKAGIEAFTRTLAREVGQYRIRVNCVAPSVTLNPFLVKQMPAESVAEITKRMPLGDISPDDQAKAILFLLSDDAAMISGATLNVTAGY
jgi:3-oxoacyl-[acyl-carrier protein] reductase